MRAFLENKIAQNKIKQNKIATKVVSCRLSKQAQLKRKRGTYENRTTPPPC